MGTQTGAEGGGAEMRELELRDLVSRPERCSVLSARARAALRRRLAGGRPYPALVVRRHPRREGKYEILDGHCRAETLRDLGAAVARCEVWPATDDEADVLGLTLNYLRGGADAGCRARAARRIVRRLGEKAAAEEMGLTPAKLRQWLRPLAPAGAHASVPAVGRQTATKLDLRPLIFHVTPAEAEAIERALAGRGQGADSSERRARRGAALANALAGQPQDGPALNTRK